MISAYPLAWPAGWPRTRQPTYSAFKNTGHVTTLALLAEIKRLGGTQVVLSTNVRLRQDGLPYANDKPPEDKGVAVYFMYRGKQMVFACDKWNRLHDNIQSIRKTIEALRGIERWGASDMMERAFQGFTALPAPGESVTRKPLDCWDILRCHDYASREEITEQRNRLARIYHPDSGAYPDADKMAEVNRAYEQAMKEAQR